MLALECYIYISRPIIDIHIQIWIKFVSGEKDFTNLTNWVTADSWWMAEWQPWQMIQQPWIESLCDSWWVIEWWCTRHLALLRGTSWHYFLSCLQIFLSIAKQHQWTKSSEFRINNMQMFQYHIFCPSVTCASIFYCLMLDFTLIL